MRDSLQKHDQGAGSAVYFLGFGKRHYAVTLLQPPTHLFLQHRVAALTSIPFPMHDTDAAGSGFLRGLKELHDGFPRRIHPKTVEINMVLHSPVTAAQFFADIRRQTVPPEAAAILTLQEGEGINIVRDGSLKHCLMLSLGLTRNRRGFRVRKLRTLFVRIGSTPILDMADANVWASRACFSFKAWARLRSSSAARAFSSSSLPIFFRS